MEEIQKLRNAVKGKRTTVDFELVNKCIDEIVSSEKEDGVERKIKALICQVEGKLNKINVYTVLAIGYALLIEALTIADGILKSGGYGGLSIILFCISIIATMHVAVVACNTIKEVYENTFILKALYFKLEELKNKSEKIEKQNEDNNYREFVVRVSEK